jgi:hypothetical protein
MMEFYRQPLSVNPGLDGQMAAASLPNSSLSGLRRMYRLLLTFVVLMFLGSWQTVDAAGTWTRLNNTAPNGISLMLLLTDGTVMAQVSGPSGTNGWCKLTPDSRGSYINGTWSTLASMHDTRLYGSSDVLTNGRVFIAGAEYGTGGSTAEVYDPLTNTWTLTPSAGQGFSDAVSTTLPNGNVLVAPVAPAVSGGTVIYNISNNTWSGGPRLFRGSYQDEASWVKLPDQSILTIDPFGTNSERYIPSSNQWIDDGIVPVSLYDAKGELGAAVLLPNGKAFFQGATGHTALYTPSGNNNPGTWAAGPDFPPGLGTDDAPSAMMVSGVVLCTAGPSGTYNGPTSFFEYDPNANSFTQVNGPTGLTDGAQPFGTRFLDLPDGSVLYSNGGSQLYAYRPSGAALAAGKPTINNLSRNADGSYHLVGTQLTGISEGAAYGDDAQMATNYPIVRLTDSSGNVYFGRSYNWSTVVMAGNTQQSTEFTVPAGLPNGNYSLQVVTNGITSNGVSFFVGAMQQYTYVASESGTVNFSTPADVAYGAGSGFAYKYALSGNVTFNNATFGDPAPGMAKGGYYNPFVQCASENGSATFTVPVEAAYGGQGKYYYNQGISGTVAFNNGVWGDPIAGAAKAGYYMPYTQCATEGQSYTFSSPTNIAFGANGKYSFMYGITGTITFNTTTFGDPIFGVAKAGYFRPTSVTPSFGLANASFETPSVGAGGYQYNPTGGSWTFSGKSGIQSNGSGWGAPTAPNGTQTAFLQVYNGGSNGSISQTVNFGSAGTYTLTFQSALRATPHNGAISFNILVDGTLLGICTPTTTTSFTSYATSSFTVTTAGNHTVTFTAAGTAVDSSVFIDAIGIH